MNRTGIVTVALSGGKDSTASILHLRQAGYPVEAVTMKLGIPGEEEKLEKISHLTRLLDVPSRILDMQKEFQEKVISYFVLEYRRGRTPNPCIACNRFLKFGLLLEQVSEPGGGTFATGHYAAIVSRENRLFLTEPAERRKSQIYFLAHIRPQALSRVIFPLATLTLSDVKKTVAGLPLANLSESQDVCFLSGISLGEFLREKIPEAFEPGEILDPEGKAIGRHQGIVHYTVGQRRGTRFASGQRLYVLRIDVDQRAIILADDSYLQKEKVLALHPNYWREIFPGQRFRVKIRSQHGGEEAEILSADSSHILARFQKPVRALTPGQYAVFYEGDRIAASGVIEDLEFHSRLS